MQLIKRLFQLIIVSLLFFGSGYAARAEKSEWSRPFMGTFFHITIYSSSRDDAEKAVYRAFDRIEKLEETLSFYRDNSELNQLVKNAGSEAVIAGPDLFEVLESALYWSRQTGGAFDCTIRPLITLWHTRGQEGVLVSSAEIAEAREHLGFNKVLLNPRLHSVRLLAPGMQLDLGGIAKGFSADKALESLKQDGIRIALIDAGGDLRMGDPPPGRKGWLVTLDNSGCGPSRLELADAAIATSGDKYKFYEVGGIRYSHIVDPKTGMGMTGHRQVTVITGDAETADALATALSVMKIEDGLELINSLDNTEALIRVMDSGSEKILGQPHPRETQSGKYIISEEKDFPGDYKIFKTRGFPKLY
jgi:FAD:protein FMN transferase